MGTLRRWLVILSLMFWQGGFMFYGGVVVPVGSEVLGSDTDQGWITRKVTDYLNAAGVVALAVWGWDILAARDPTPRRRRLRRAAWVFLAAALGVLVWLHGRLDGYLDPEALRILDRSRFRNLHRWYLATSTVQWAVALALVFWTLRAWRAEDARVGDPAHENGA